MIINTDLTTVTFTKDEVLTFEALGDVLNALERIRFGGLPQWEWDLLQESPLERERRQNREALAALQEKLEAKTKVTDESVVQSDRDFRVFYRIKGFKDGHYECTCPDFEHRGHDKDGNLVPGYECKHLRRYRFKNG